MYDDYRTNKANEKVIFEEKQTEESDNEENFLGHKIKFDFILKKPSLEEKINLEEQDLVDTISLMNEYYRGDSKFKNEFANFFNNSDLTEKEEEKEYFGSSSTTDTSLIEDIIKKNLNPQESNLKLLLIGNKGVGKTKFKNILLKSTSQANSQLNSDDVICPTLA